VTTIAALSAINQNNLINSPFTSLSINVLGNSRKNAINNSTSTLNAETTKIPLQHTGVPIAGFILAILMIVSGSIIPKLKR
jgi:Mg2+/Co2+ transporter CorB